MKYLTFIATGFFFFFLSALPVFAAVSVSPTFIATYGATPFTITYDSVNDYVCTFDVTTNGTYHCTGATSPDTESNWTAFTGGTDNNPGQKHVVEILQANLGACLGTYAACHAVALSETLICVYDNTACAGGGGGGGSFDDTDGLPFGTTTTVYNVIDNPNQDYFYGVFLFFALCFGVIAIFKKRT